MNPTRFRSLWLLALVAALALVAGACSQQARAERDGRDLADAICDLRNATDSEAAASATEEISKQLDDLQGRYGAATAEDRADIQNNLADLAEHAIQGNDVLIQQDLTVLKRSAENISNDVGDLDEAAWNGFADGVQECIND